MSKYKVLGVCAGSGAALLFPFLNQKGFQVLGNIEPRPVFHTRKEEQWTLNFGELPFWKRFELPDLNPDILVSSPDCGSVSMMRLSKKKKWGVPEKNKTLNLVFEAIDKYKPKMFLIENLPRLLNFISEDKLQEKFPDYKLVFHCASVMEWGNHQKSRIRLVIIGIKLSCKRRLNSFNKIFQVNTPKNYLELKRITNRKLNFIPNPKKQLAMYDYRKLPEKKNLKVWQIRRLWKTDFKDEYKWPIKTAKMKTLPGVYRLKPFDYPLTLRPSDRQFAPSGWPLGAEFFRVIMGVPRLFKTFMPKYGKRDPDYDYYLNKVRYTYAKGSVYEIGKWFRICLVGNNKVP